MTRFPGDDAPLDQRRSADPRCRSIKRALRGEGGNRPDDRQRSDGDHHHAAGQRRTYRSHSTIAGRKLRRRPHQRQDVAHHEGAAHRQDEEAQEVGAAEQVISHGVPRASSPKPRHQRKHQGDGTAGSTEPTRASRPRRRPSGGAEMAMLTPAATTRSPPATVARAGRCPSHSQAASTTTTGSR
ncbi:MAG: hypothetical protein QOF30_1039 [Acidimicrobiaceae bacterium]|nr:hypothetical protein [Acidimicrobiaceae bacterium]